MHPYLCCPACRHALPDDPTACENPECGLAGEPFPVAGGQTVLIDPSDSIVDPASVGVASIARSPIATAVARVTSSNAVARRIAQRLLADVRAGGGHRPRILIIGGGTIGSGLEALYDATDVQRIGFDIFASPHTDFVADAHRIPLADGSVDAVIVQAVLEHVLDPWRVASEIHRVLVPGGRVYADTPFLQHVHEGAYDFTRFTESGHRWLFRDFTLVESGVVAGPGTQLAWSLAHVTRTFVPLRGVATAVRLLMAVPAMLADRFASSGAAVDGASSVYFYGRRSERSLAPAEMIEHYQGNQGTSSRRRV